MRRGRGSNQVTRRNFLRGLGGAAIAMPLMMNGLGRHAFAQAPPGSMTADGFPKRFIYFYHPNGVLQDIFWPTAGASEREFQLGRILSPLEPHRNKLIIPKGLELVSGRAEHGPGEPHQRGMGLGYECEPALGIPVL